MKKITFLFAVLLTAIMANAITKQYAVADIATLQADLNTGAADIYELTTPGGVYILGVTNSSSSSLGTILTKNTTLRAAANLYAKPIICSSSTSTSSTGGIFTSTTANVTLTLQGIECTGISTGSNLSYISLFYSSGTNNSFVASNCFFHDFALVSATGLIRLDGLSGSSINVQNSVISNSCGRIFYFGIVNTAATKYGDLTLKNNTFCNLPSMPTGGANATCVVLYKSGITYGGTALIDHNTFYKCNVGNEIFLFRTGGASTPYMTSITISNNIFDQVLLTLTSVASPAYQISNCYLAGLASAPPTTYAAILNTQSTVPTYVNPLILDFTLANKSSFNSSTGTADGIGDMSYYPVLPALSTPAQPNDAVLLSPVSVTASWTSVSGASAYMVYVYNAAKTAIVKSSLVSGQSSQSTAITGLAGSTTYYYTVKAMSDGSANSNSIESPYSNSFTTPAPAQLTKPEVSAATAVSAESFNANWTPLSSTVNYTIKVYDSTPALVKTVVTPTQFTGTLNSINITGLSLNTNYTYTVTAMGDAVSTLTSSESDKSNVVTTLSTYPTSIITNFADGTWGVVSSLLPTSTTFPSFSANGFDFALSQDCNNGSSTGPKGEIHTHRIGMDKGSSGSMITLPTVASVSQLEIHAAAAASTLRTLTVQQLIGSTWINIGSGTGTNGTGIYDLPNSTELIYVIQITSNNTNAKFRLVSSTGNTGSISILQVITRTTTPETLALPTVAVSDVASSISSTGFTANWSTGDVRAQGYKVFVYSGSTLVKTTNTANDNTLRSLAITDLTPSTTYTYKVGSLGDGDNLYSDSYVSATSASFSTLADLGTDVPKVSNNSVLKIVGKTIFSSEMGDIEIYNLQGSIIIEVRNTNKTTVNVANGLYIIRFLNDKGIEIIQKVLLK